jgi:hypothetical protein
MTIDISTLATEVRGDTGRTRQTTIPTARENVIVLVTTHHYGRPSYAGALGHAYRTVMNVVEIEQSEPGVRVHSYLPHDAVGVLTTGDVARFSARSVNDHHARALDVIAAIADPTRPVPDGVPADRITAAAPVLARWLTGDATER